jgi:hypothetical protein
VRWHATRTGDWNADLGGEVTMRMAVAPPLSRAAAEIEVLAAGQSAKVRAKLPLRWGCFLCRTIRRFTTCPCEAQVPCGRSMPTVR